MIHCELVEGGVVLLCGTSEETQRKSSSTFCYSLHANRLFVYSLHLLTFNSYLHVRLTQQSSSISAVVGGARRALLTLLVVFGGAAEVGRTLFTSRWPLLALEVLVTLGRGFWTEGALGLLEMLGRVFSVLETLG